MYVGDMFDYMNYESMTMEIDGSLCSVSGCKNKSIKTKHVGGGICIALCSEHAKSY